ncbi:MAG: MerR family transcriptional regulator [Halanaerobium sp.]|nr:MerR family transcriptional regulator [Halanaerobium sp.]
MYIGEFAKETGLTPDTLRYYDRIGLLVPERRNQYRLYQEEDLQKALEIQELQSLGFSLEEVREILTLDRRLDMAMASGGRDSKGESFLTDLLAMLEAKYRDINNKEEEIKKVKYKLEHLLEKVRSYWDGR